MRVILAGQAAITGLEGWLRSVRLLHLLLQRHRARRWRCAFSGILNLCSNHSA